MQREPVLFVGLGRMGAPMAAAVANAGYDVRRWSRSSAASLAEVAQGCSVAVLMLTDADAVEEVVFERGLGAALGAGSIIIDMGTTGVAHARSTSRRLSDSGIGYIDAPVSGGVVGASNATLAIFVGAELSDFKRCSRLLRSMGRPKLLGPVGSGQGAKLANQVTVAVSIAALAEGIRLAESFGLSAVDFVAALEGGFADSTIRRVHGPRMATRDFGSAGPVRLHLKDLLLAASEPDQGFGSLALAPLVLRRFKQLIEAGQGDIDHSGYLLTYDLPDATTPQ